MIKVLVADDHEMVRIGVSAYLSSQQDIEIVAEAEDGGQAVELALQLKPDIILMDLVMKESFALTFQFGLFSIYCIDYAYGQLVGLYFAIQDVENHVLPRIAYA